MPASLYVREMGSGEPLLLIHGLMVTGDMFQPVTTALAAHFRLLIPDLPLHGSSGVYSESPSMEQFAEAVLDALTEREIPAAHVLGYSLGGAVAQALALRAPARVRRLILAATFPKLVLDPAKNLQITSAQMLLGVLGAARMAPLVLAMDGGRRPTPEQHTFFQSLLASNQTGRMLEAFQALRQFDSRAQLGAIQAPTLILAGDADSSATLEHARLLAQGIPDARLVVFPDAGHLLIATHADAFAREVLAFLQASALTAAARQQESAARG